MRVPLPQLAVALAASASVAAFAVGLADLRGLGASVDAAAARRADSVQQVERLRSLLTAPPARERVARHHPAQRS